MILIYFSSFSLPMMMNLGRIKICDFIKGCIYAIILAPTYINIVPIYSISNLHNVTWGSRPAVEDKNKNSKFEETERKREVDYKDFRSNFLIIWLLINIIVSQMVTHLARNGNQFTILGVGIFLTFVISVKLVGSLFFYFTSWVDSCRIPTNKSLVFSQEILQSKFLNFTHAVGELARQNADKVMFRVEPRFRYDNITIILRLDTILLSA